MKCEYEGCEQEAAQRFEAKMLCRQHLYELMDLIPTNYYCRSCGVHSLFVEPGEGDYYVGPNYYCKSCKEVYTMG